MLKVIIHIFSGSQYYRKRKPTFDPSKNYQKHPEKIYKEQTFRNSPGFKNDNKKPFSSSFWEEPRDSPVKGHPFGFWDKPKEPPKQASDAYWQNRKSSTESADQRRHTADSPVNHNDQRRYSAESAVNPNEQRRHSVETADYESEQGRYLEESADYWSDERRPPDDSSGYWQQTALPPYLKDDLISLQNKHNQKYPNKKTQPR